MAQLSMTGTGDAREIANTLIGEVQNSAMSCQLVDRVGRELDGLTYELLVFEKYYMRSSNRASLSIVVIGRGEDVFVDAVGAGGGQGVFFKFSWGRKKIL